MYYMYSKYKGRSGEWKVTAPYTPLTRLSYVYVHTQHRPPTPSCILHASYTHLHASYKPPTHTIGRGRPHASTRIFMYLYKSIYYK